MSAEHDILARLLAQAEDARRRTYRLELGAQVVEELIRLRASAEGPEAYAAHTLDIEVVARLAGRV